MAFRALINQANLVDRRDIYIALTIPGICFFTAKLLANLISASTYNGILPKAHIYRAPSQRLLTPAEEENLPYPPDALPGGRNIDTPHGNVRAYEWGPREGRKVMFVPGISTPCIALAKIAKGLVRKGCRVLLFDLHGRGYSDAPDPSVVRHDVSLFCSQMLSVLASSELNWMEGFTLVGYSLGGGISAEFASYYPNLVRSLVLLTPGGLLRPARVSLSSKLLYSGFLPDSFVHYWVGSKLRGGGAKPNVPKMKALARSRSKIDVADAVVEELPQGHSAHGKDSESPIFEDRPKVSPATAVAWQIEAHPGFISSFVSSVRFGPIHDGFRRWRMIGRRCEARRGLSQHAEEQTSCLTEGKVLVILGLQDVVISSKETAEDASAALGRDNIQVVTLKGGHDIPLTNSEGCVSTMTDFWAGAI